MTEQPINGAAPPTPEQAQALVQAAADEYGRALVQSRTLGQQINIDVMALMVEIYLQKIQLGLLLETLSGLGAVDPVAWKQLLAERLRAATAEFNKPQIALAVGASMRRS